MATLIIDADYTLFEPGFTKNARPIYRFLRRISPELTERLIECGESLLGGYLEYLAVSLVNRTPLMGAPSPIVDPYLLNESRKKYDHIGVYSLRPKDFVDRDIEVLGYHVDVVVGPRNIPLRSFLSPKSIRRDCIIRCMTELGANPNSTTLGSDSPMDHKIAKELGIAETWAFPSFYRRIERHNPDRVWISLQQALLQVTSRVYT